MVFHTSSPSLVAALKKDGFFLCLNKICLINLFAKYKLLCYTHDEMLRKFAQFAQTQYERVLL